MAARPTSVMSLYLMLQNQMECVGVQPWSIYYLQLWLSSKYQNVTEFVKDFSVHYLEVVLVLLLKTTEINYVLLCIIQFIYCIQSDDIFYNYAVWYQNGRKRKLTFIIDHTWANVHQYLIYKMLTTCSTQHLLIIENPNP